MRTRGRRARPQRRPPPDRGPSPKHSQPPLPICTLGSHGSAGPRGDQVRARNAGNSGGPSPEPRTAGARRSPRQTQAKAAPRSLSGDILPAPRRRLRKGEGRGPESGVSARRPRPAPAQFTTMAPHRVGGPLRDRGMHQVQRTRGITGLHRVRGLHRDRKKHQAGGGPGVRIPGGPHWDFP